MTQRTLLMIRPEGPARSFVSALEIAMERSIETVFSPLIGIDPLACNLGLEGVTLLLFTSINGVKQFARTSNIRNIPAICVGKTTQHAAISEGMKAVNAGGTAQKLLTATLAQCRKSNETVLYVRGEQVSFDLLAAIKSEGINAKSAILYRQIQLQPTAQAIELLLNVPVVIPVFSVNGAETLLSSLDIANAADLWLLCISPTVANHFKQTGIANVHTADLPNRAAMIRALGKML